MMPDGGLILVELLAVLLIDALEVAFERAVAGDAAGRRQRADHTENCSGFDQTILPLPASHAMKLPMWPS